MNTDRTQITSLCNPITASLWEARLKSVKGVAHRATATAIPPDDCNNNPRKSVLIRGQQVSVFSHELLNPTYDTVEFVDQIRMIAVLPKRGHQRAIVPERSILLARKALEHFQTMSS
jgi:hypothetical protein